MVSAEQSFSSLTITDSAPPVIPSRLHGVNLKLAEQLVRRLLLHQPLLPSYVAPPPLSPTTSDTLMELLSCPSAFTDLLPASIDPAWRAHESLSQCEKEDSVTQDPTTQFRSSGVPPLRAARKRSQILALLRILSPLLTQNKVETVFDFCSGCGHVGLVVAALFPYISVTLVDTRSVPLQIAKRRAEAANLPNVHYINSRVENLADDITFDLAIGLHACGAASDAILAQATKRRAAIVLAPCCVGAVCNNPVLSLSSTLPQSKQQAQPRSNIFATLTSKEEYSHLARAADFGEAALQRDEWRFVAKSLVEYDRLQSLCDAGYSTTHLVKMRPTNCTPKNDVLVAWSSSIASQNNDNLWPVDHLANGLLTDFLDASVLNGLGIAEVRAVETTLRKNVCELASPGVYRSSPGCGKRGRKLIHAVSESLALVHESVGRGVDRHVIVRRHVHWPLFFDNYLGIGGPQVDQLSTLLSQFVPPHYVERRKFVRGSPCHITIISPREISLLPSRHKRDREFCVADIYREIQGTSFSILGVGRVQKGTSSLHRREGVSSNKKEELIENVPEEETYFGIIKWPEVQAVRHRLKLPSSHLHITLGFKNKDVHCVAKDISTLTHSSEHKCLPWSVI